MSLSLTNLNLNKKLFSFILVIIAGETIFMLPFLIPRLYRPLMIQAWNISNTDIGTAFSAYGFTAMISYILGGGLADKYSPKYLMAISLIVTALGGTFLLIYPSKITFILVYCFFGISTILLMWAALIKTSHLAGGNSNRAMAMGILDAGRGLIAAIMSSILIITISQIFSADSLNKNPRKALNIIYFIVGLFNILVGVLIWKNYYHSEPDIDSGQNKWSIKKANLVALDLKVWLLGLIILAAYCGYKSIDNYSVYLVDIHKLSLEDSSQMTSLLFWLRPLSALVTGILADKFHKVSDLGRFKLLFFLLALNSIFQFILIFMENMNLSIIFMNIILSATFAYALRAVYFSIFGDLKFKDHLVGTTVGITSFLGFLPDMFFGIITGSLIDNHPGVLGYHYTFIFTGSVLLIGSLASYKLYRLAKKL